jgi:hypothetical protein
MASLLLSTDAWDLCVDSKGNIAVANEPYSNAQDAACHLRLFKGELRYDTSQGMPYEWQILGAWPAPSVLKAYMAAQALLATGVATAMPIITSWVNRAIGGAVLVTNTSQATPGRPVAAPFVISPGATSI